MANFNSTIADRVVDAKDSGKEAKFIFNSVEYEFTPAGLMTFWTAYVNTLPTSDPAVVGALWLNSGVLTVSAG